MEKTVKNMAARVIIRTPKKNGDCAYRPVPDFGSDGVTVRKQPILYCSTSYGQVVMPPNS